MFRDQDISVIETGSKSVSVFEGYMDFLSCLTLSGHNSGAANAFKEELPTVIIQPQNYLYSSFNDLNDFLKDKSRKQVG